MASSKAFRDFIMEHFSDLEDITYRPMMGEFLLYYNGVLFGGIYDDRLLVKITKNNSKFNLPEAIPYEHAKPMFLVVDLEDRETLSKVILATVNDLKN